MKGLTEREKICVISGYYYANGKALSKKDKQEIFKNAINNIIIKEQINNFKYIKV
jgi:hypothetical protein